uniref:Low-density lipoprotein receptor class A domain-containing protein 3-like n=1 Tax=Crassostrea virginica TaxID=6565 RepID=A0A8B8EYG0_CRAVI|nr:low-density lipoprotein receptor class A domain-containing protein 3-like [Crassostrea virginica]
MHTLPCISCLTLVLSLWISAAEATLQAVYLSSSSASSASFTTSMRIQSSTGLTYSNNANYVITVTAPSGHKVLAIPRRFELEEKRSGACVDYLNFYDGTTTGSLINPQPYCDRDGPHNVSSSSTSMTLEFVTDGSARYRGFDIIFAAYTNAPCASNYYGCSNGLCIDQTLRCDSFNQCGDESDEAACTAEELGLVDDNSALIYGLAFGLGSFVVITIIIGVLVYRHYKWKRFLNEPIPKEHYSNALRNYPVTNKYYKKPYQTAYAYTNVPSRMSNDFETDDDLDVASRPTSPSSSDSKKSHQSGAKAGKINMNSSAGSSNC